MTSRSASHTTGVSSVVVLAVRIAVSPSSRARADRRSPCSRRSRPRTASAVGLDQHLDADHRRRARRHRARWHVTGIATPPRARASDAHHAPRNSTLVPAGSRQATTSCASDGPPFLDLVMHVLERQPGRRRCRHRATLSIDRSRHRVHAGERVVEVVGVEVVEVVRRHVDVVLQHRASRQAGSTSASIVIVARLRGAACPGRTSACRPRYRPRPSCTRHPRHWRSSPRCPAAAVVHARCSPPSTVRCSSPSACTRSSCRPSPSPGRPSPPSGPPRP